jgi:hypothetical protein
MVQTQFLGKAITGLGGGCSKLFVIEGNINAVTFSEGEGYQGILNPLHPFDSENDQFYSAEGEDSKSAIVVTNGRPKDYQSSPFD